MEEKTKNNKKTFLSRVKTAVFKLEKYGDFLEEPVTVAFKYFFLLVFFTSLIISITLTFDFSKIINKGYNYLKNEIPEFSLEDNVLKFNDYIEGYDEEYNFKLIIDTFDIEDTKIKEYKNSIESTGTGMIFLKNKIMIFSNGNQVYDESYSNLITSFGLDNIKNKESLIELYGEFWRFTSVCIFFVFNVFLMFLINVISILADMCMVSIIGWFIAKLCGMNLKIFGSIELTIYSLTLSIILSAVYTSVNILIPNFRIEYFNIISLLITYVYLIAALFIIKDDLIKQNQELQEIYRVEDEVRLELEKENEKEENESETEKENKPEDKLNDNEESNDSEEGIKEEPDGSEI